jgi:hypothetical protein
MLEYHDGTWKATLIFDDRSRSITEPLLETGWHPQLITPDNAYMLLMHLTCSKIHERAAEDDTSGAAEHEGSVRMSGSGEQSN